MGRLPALHRNVPPAPIFGANCTLSTRLAAGPDVLDPCFCFGVLESLLPVLHPQLHLLDRGPYRVPCPLFRLHGRLLQFLQSHMV